MEKMPPSILKQYGTTRNFKAIKRREFDAVLNAFNNFRLGCAFTPGFETYCDRLEAIMKNWREQLKVQNWGR